MRVHMGKAEEAITAYSGDRTSGSHTQLNGWETAICAKLFSWERNCINEDGMWRRERQREERQRQRAVRKRHSLLTLDPGRSVP